MTMNATLWQPENNQQIDMASLACNRNHMIGGAQIRAARALLRWGPYELARRAGLSYATIQRAEAADDFPEGMRVGSMVAIQRTLENAGVVFMDAGEMRPGGPGVRMRSATQ